MPKKYGKRKQTPDLKQTELYDKVTKLQSEIIADLQYLNKKRNDKFDCVHCYQEVNEQYDPQKNYFDQFWKAYLINSVCIKRFQDYRDWIRKLNKKIKNVQEVYMQRKKIMEPIDAKRRKKNSQLNSNQFQCQQCGKKYKDEESLKIHNNLKHNQQDIKIQAKIQQIHIPYMDCSQSQKHEYFQQEE